MKTLTFYTLMTMLLASCSSTYTEIGGLGMLTDKKVDPNGHYKKMATALGATKKEIKSTTADNMNQAIDEILNKIPGSLFLTNVKVYIVKGDYLAVSGDVWAPADERVATNPKPAQQNAQVAVSGTH